MLSARSSTTTWLAGSRRSSSRATARPTMPAPTMATSHVSGGSLGTTYDHAPLSGRLRHVGLNAVFLQPRFGGVEAYVRALIPEILELLPDLRLTLFVNHPQRDYLAAEDWAGRVELASHPLIGRRFTSA